MTKNVNQTNLSQGSIGRRLTVQLLIIAALLSLIFFIVAREIAGQAAVETQDNVITASATSIADALRSDGQKILLDMPYSALSMLGALSQDRVFYRVQVNGETITGYDDLTITLRPTVTTEPVFQTLNYRGEVVRAVTILRQISLSGTLTDVTVTVAQTRLAVQSVSKRFSFIAAILGLAFFVTSVLLSLAAARNALRPLRRLAQAMARRGPRDLTPVGGKTPDELVPLVYALNSFMDRLQRSITRSEDFIAEAAHRIRTPLATVRTQAEVSLHRVEKSVNKQALRDMIRAVDESSRSASQMLDHAMVAFRMDRGDIAPVDLRIIVRETCSRLELTAQIKDIDLYFEEPSEPCIIQGDAILLENAFRNILDNAIKYSAADKPVHISIANQNKGFCVVVKDQGRGVQGQDLTALLCRFSRGGNVGDVVGSGLGLTIAQDVAVTHGGTIDIASNEDGIGACVRVFFPHS